MITNSYVFSQTSFYLKPVFGSKFCSTVPGVATSDILGITSAYNPYVNHQTLRFVRMNGYDVGFDAGVQMNKHFLEFQYYYTSLNTGFVGSHFTYSDTYGEMNYTNFHFKEKYGLAVHKISFGYNYEAYRSKSNRFGLRVTGNVGIYYNHKFDKNMWAYNYKSVSSFSDYRLDENVSFERLTNNHTYYHRFSGFASIGAGFDFYTKSKRNLFSIDISYTQGFRMLHALTTTYTVLDNSTLKNYSYVATGNGSTLNFQISRRFQLYPWIKSKRKELQEQGVYKSKD